MTQLIQYRGALYIRADKLDDVDPAELNSTPKRWQELLSSFPEGLIREIMDERPRPDQQDLDELATWTLRSRTPVSVQLTELLRHPENRAAVARTPADVVEDINEIWGTTIQPGKVYDRTPARYREYAKLPASSAKPSVMVDGEVIWGVGRLIAALLRGDKTMKVWDITG
jgi:hypothetical protein